MYLEDKYYIMKIMMVFIIIVLGYVIYYLYELNNKITKQIDSKVYYRWSKLNKSYNEKYNRLSMQCNHLDKDVNMIYGILDDDESGYSGDNEENKDDMDGVKVKAFKPFGKRKIKVI